MNDKDNPFGVGGGGDRTVFRPNPGGRLPPQPPQQPDPFGRPPPPPPPNQFARPAPMSGAGGPQGSEDWIQTSRPQEPAEAMQRAEDLHFDELAAQHENPIMRAAGPLLLLLGRLRVAMLRASAASLIAQVVAAIKFFEEELGKASIVGPTAEDAKYIVCATADDIVQNLPAEGRHVWTQYSMLSQFFGRRDGGLVFFQHLERLKKEPAVNYNVLELQHACLALGFRGVHGTSGGDMSKLQIIQRDLYETLRRIRPREARHLSPRWQGQALGIKNQRFRLPVWVIAGLAGLALFALFAALRSLLGGESERVAQANLGMHALAKVALQRRLPSPPPEPVKVADVPQAARIAAAVGPGTETCPITSTPQGPWIVIRVCSGIMFASGDAVVLPQFMPVRDRILAMLEKEPGPVMIIGHTDSVPLRPTNRFKNNQQLSVERARAAAAVLTPGMAQPGRVKIEGRGSDEPLQGMDNKTEPTRAPNRRVEFLVTRKD